MRTLSQIANDIEDFAARMQQFIPEEARTLRGYADEIAERHYHADPCDSDESDGPKPCPCRQAEEDAWREAGHGDDCRRNP